MDNGLFMIDISLDAATEETYKKIRRGLPFEKVIENVNRMITIRDKKKSPIKIMVSFVKQKDNLKELELFEREWKDKVDKVLIREMISNVNLVKTDANTAGVERWPCPHLFRRIVINYDGIIKMCPVDWENKTSYLSVKETSIYDAWHSEFYRKNRSEHLNNDFSPDSPCGPCSDWLGSPWALGYEKVIKKLSDGK